GILSCETNQFCLVVRGKNVWHYSGVPGIGRLLLFCVRPQQSGASSARVGECLAHSGERGAAITSTGELRSTGQPFRLRIAEAFVESHPSAKRRARMGHPSFYVIEQEVICPAE